MNDFAAMHCNADLRFNAVINVDSRALINQLDRLVDRLMRFTAVQRIIKDERDWLFRIHVENTVRTCVFNAFSTRIRQVQKVGGRVMSLIIGLKAISPTCN